MKLRGMPIAIIAIAGGLALTACDNTEQAAPPDTQSERDAGPPMVGKVEDEPAKDADEPVDDKATEDQADEPAPADSDEPEQRRDDVLYPDGFGDLRLGMTLEEAKAALPDLKITVGGNGDTCKSYYAESTPGVAVRFGPLADGAIRLAVINVADQEVQTPEGIGDGSSWKAVRAAYPDATTEHKSQMSSGTYAFVSMSAERTHVNQLAVADPDNACKMVGAA